jgi:hypothetical protein
MNRLVSFSLIGESDPKVLAIVVGCYSDSRKLFSGLCNGFS